MCQRLLLSSLLLSVSCSTAVRQNMENPSRLPYSQIVTITDAKLTNLVLQFLTMSESHPGYAVLTHELKVALSEYLRGNGTDEELFALRLQRKGMTFVLPVQLLRLDRIQSVRVLPPAKTLQPFGKPIGPPFKGEIVDLAWLTGKSGKQHLLALMADSVIAMAWPMNGSYQTTVVFGADKNHRARAAFSEGFFIAPDVPSQKSRAIAALTSSLDRPVILSAASGGDDLVRIVEKSDSTEFGLNGSSWMRREGQPLFRSRSDSVSFLSFRKLAGSNRAVFVDDLGHLKLAGDSLNHPVWTSRRPWGNRVFLLDVDQEIVGVCDSRQNSFVGFQHEDGEMVLLGQSPPFEGPVSAVLPLDAGKTWPLIVSVVTRDRTGVSWSQLFQITDELVWQLPIRYDRPLFPDYNAEFTFVVERSSISEFQSVLDFPATLRFNTVESLFRLTADGGVVPWLAADAKSDSAARVWTISLRPGIRFADGSPMTAEDVLKSWHATLITKDRQVSDLWPWSEIVGTERYTAGRQNAIEGIRVLDSHNLEITLNVPRPRFLEYLAHADFGVLASSSRKDRILGTGPYFLKSVDRAGEAMAIRCERNPYYHGGVVPLKTVRFMMLGGNPLNLLSELNTGALVRRRKDIQYFRQIEKFSTTPFPVRTTYFLAINPNIAPLTNPDLRYKIAFSVISRSEIADMLTEAEAIVAPALISENDIEVRAPNSSTATLHRPVRVAYRKGDGIAHQIAQRLVARFAQSGMPSRSPDALSNENFELLRRSGKYHIMVDSITPKYSTDLNNLGQLLSGGFAVDPAVKTEFQVALANRASAKALQLEKKLVEESVIHPVIQVNSYAVLPSDLKLATLLGTDHVDFSKAWMPKK